MKRGAALVLVDLQEDFLARPGLEPPRGALLASATRWLDRWRREGGCIAHVRMATRRDDPRRMAHWPEAGPFPCEENTAGAATPASVAEVAGEPVFEKRGYLPSPAPLLEWLESRGCHRVVLAGVMTHACVTQLAALLAGEGCKVSFATGAIGSDRPGAAAHALAYWASKGVHAIEFESDNESSCEIGGAVAAARHAAAPAWGALRPALLRWADLIQREAGQLASAMMDTLGKPVSLGIEEARAAAATLHDVCRRRDTFVAESRGPGGTVARKPLGVVGILTAWNNPILIPVSRIAPALAYGNTAVWKPSPHAAKVSALVAALAGEAGVAEAWLQMVEGGGCAGQQLAWHPGVNAIAMSGSLASGRSVLAACAERLIPCQMELGGNNAAVVAEDADPADAVREILHGAFAFAGQRCTANRRVVLLPGIAEQFLHLARNALAEWTPGDPSDPSCRIGPMRSPSAAAGFEALLERAPPTARISRAPASTRPGSAAPALVEGLEWHDELVQEESFGPALIVQHAACWDEALLLVESVRQGLAASLFSTSDRLWDDFRARVRAGVLRWNRSTAGGLIGMPFGGWKASGWGGAEHGDADAEFFTRAQSSIP